MNKPNQQLLSVVLFQPEIPQNTGNIGRLCAYADTALHLIHPLGFQLTEKQLRRSGMDYWQHLDLHEHANWADYYETHRDRNIWMLTTRGTRSHWDAPFQPGDHLLFGNEGGGCADYVHDTITPEFKLKIPQYTPHLRSLNLATSVGIVLYEALRKLKNL